MQCFCNPHIALTSVFQMGGRPGAREALFSRRATYLTAWVSCGRPGESRTFCGFWILLFVAEIKSFEIEWITVELQWWRKKIQKLILGNYYYEICGRPTFGQGDQPFELGALLTTEDFIPIWNTASDCIWYSFWEPPPPLSLLSVQVVSLVLITLI